MRRRVLLLLLSLVTFGCASKGTTVVLLENPDGSVGQVEVSSQTGTQMLSAPRQATTVAAPAARPSTPHVVEQAEIDQDYGLALKILPEVPDTFLLHFETGTAELTAESLAMPERILAAITRRGSRDVRVNGHTDRVGNRESNARLSMERAEFVRNFLIGRGIAAGIIQAFAHGEGNPVVPTDDEVPEPRNRRVEVLVR